MVSTLDEEANANITELENEIVPLDSVYNKNKINSIRKQINELEKKPVQDMTYKAQLAAWSGRLYLLEGAKDNAVKQLKISRQYLPGNIQAIILSIRLESDPEKRIGLINDSMKIEKSSGELFIEQARAFFELGRYRDAVASFDKAFALLSSKVYKETYIKDRNKAWELRDITSNKSNSSAHIIERAEISWRDVIDLTQNETDLLDFITAGKNWPADQLFPRLFSRSFIPVVQDVMYIPLAQENIKNPSIDDKVLRCGAAWFLWHLVAENRLDKTLLTKYSARYKNIKNAKTPIPDIPMLSFYFDSVLGCIEWEIMTLPDGKNFSPNEPVKGSAFANMLGKIKK